MIETKIDTTKYIERIFKNKLHNIDAVVLGCTHFPIIKNVFKKVFNKYNFKGVILDPNKIMVNQLI